MVFASGFIEVDSTEVIGKVECAVRVSDIEVPAIHQDRILYLIERETSAEAKKVIESLKEIEGVKNVYLAYFSLEE